MQYADDNTPTTADKDPEKLQKKVQSEADLVTGWFSYNRMVCSGDKTKLLIIGTGANRADKLERPGKVLQVVHQLVAYHSLNQVYKIYRDKKPQYHYNRLFGSNQHDTITRGGARTTSRVDFLFLLLGHPFSFKPQDFGTFSH